MVQPAASNRSSRDGFKTKSKKIFDSRGIPLIRDRIDKTDAQKIFLHPSRMTPTMTHADVGRSLIGMHQRYNLGTT
jgi:hypothetical protein